MRVRDEGFTRNRESWTLAGDEVTILFSLAFPTEFGSINIDKYLCTYLLFSLKVLSLLKIKERKQKYKSLKHLRLL